MIDLRQSRFLYQNKYKATVLKIVKAIVLVLVQYKAIVLVLVQYGNPLLILEFLSMGIVAVWIYKVEWIVMEISDNVKE